MSGKSSEAPSRPVSQVSSPGFAPSRNFGLFRREFAPGRWGKRGTGLSAKGTVGFWVVQYRGGVVVEWTHGGDPCTCAS